MPGTAVLIGLYGPRISGGASGLRSQVSRWLGPPHSRMKITDFSAGTKLPEELPRTPAATTPGVARLIVPRPAACRKRRRETADVDIAASERGRGGSLKGYC